MVGRLPRERRPNRSSGALPQTFMVCGAVDLIGRVMTIQAKVEVRLDLAEILKWISVLIWLFQ